MASDQKTSATTLMQDISQQVTCSICLDHFKMPKTLPCLHNFCRDCLQETIQSSAHPKMPDPINYPGNAVVFSFPCPACRADVNFPVPVPQPLNMREIAENAATNDFKTNFHIESQLDMLKKKLEQGCVEHQGETLLFFCKTCKKPICQLCLALEHTPPEHDITSVHKIAQEQRDEFKTKKDRVVKRKHELEKAYQGCKKKLQDMQKVKNQCKKASQELDALYAVMADFRKEMNKVESNLTTRVSRMISDNHTILNRIERCEKQSKELDSILKKTDQELLQQSSAEDTLHIHENLPQIPHVSPTSVTTPEELGLLHLCKSMAEVKQQLRGFCRQPSSTTDTSPKPKPGPAVPRSQSHNQQQQEQSPLPGRHIKPHSTHFTPFHPAWMSSFPVPTNPFTPPHSTANMWTSSNWQKLPIPPPGSFAPPVPPPPGFAQPQRPGLSQKVPSSASSSTSSSLAPPGTSLAGPSSNERLQQTIKDEDVPMPHTTHHDDDDEDDEDEDYEYREDHLSYRDGVWSDDNSDY